MVISTAMDPGAAIFWNAPTPQTTRDATRGMLQQPKKKGKGKALTAST